MAVQDTYKLATRKNEWDVYHASCYRKDLTTNKVVRYPAGDMEYEDYETGLSEIMFVNGRITNGT